MRMRTIRRRLRWSLRNEDELLKIHEMMKGIPDEETVVGTLSNKNWVDALKAVPAEEILKRL